MRTCARTSLAIQTTPLTSGDQRSTKMSRRHLALALALFVLAALAAAGLYAGNPQADRSAGSSKSSGSQALEQQVRELQNRVTSLEQRIKKLEKRPVWTGQIVSAALGFP